MIFPGQESRRFAVALFEGEGSIGEQPKGVFRLSQTEQQYLVLTGSGETVHDDYRVRAEGRLAVIRFTQRRPVRAWVVEGSKLVANEENLLTADHPVTREIAVDF